MAFRSGHFVDVFAEADESARPVKPRFMSPVKNRKIGRDRKCCGYAHSVSVVHSVSDWRKEV